MRTQYVAFVPAYVGTYVIMGALYHAGASHAIVYGVFAATGPLIVVGSAWAATAAMRQDWRSLALGAAVVAAASVGAFSGPAGAWVVTGVGTCATFLAAAVGRAWLSHRSVIARA